MQGAAPSQHGLSVKAYPCRYDCITSLSASRSRPLQLWGTGDQFHLNNFISKFGPAMCGKTFQKRISCCKIKVPFRLNVYGKDKQTTNENIFATSMARNSCTSKYSVLAISWHLQVSMVCESVRSLIRYDADRTECSICVINSSRRACVRFLVFSW